MAEKKTPKQRRMARSAILSTHRSRRPSGHPAAVTPRIAFAIKPTSVTPPHELEHARERPDHSTTPKPDAAFTPPAPTEVK